MALTGNMSQVSTGYQGIRTGVLSIACVPADMSNGRIPASYLSGPEDWVNVYLLIISWCVEMLDGKTKGECICLSSCLAFDFEDDL